MTYVVAKFDFQAVASDGNRVRVALIIECPYRVLEVQSEEWACPLSMTPLLGRRLVRGISAVQALGLALSSAQQVLTDFVQKGGCLFFDDGSPWKDASLSLGSAFGYKPPPNNSLQADRER
jgi:hypothetical protein